MPSGSGEDKLDLQGQQDPEWFLPEKRSHREDPADFGWRLGLGAEILIDLGCWRCCFWWKAAHWELPLNQSTLTQTRQQLQNARPVAGGWGLGKNQEAGHRRMPKSTGLRTRVCWERGSVNNTASHSPNKIGGCPQESQETLQVPLGPPKNTWVIFKQKMKSSMWLLGMLL